MSTGKQRRRSGQVHRTRRTAGLVGPGQLSAGRRGPGLLALAVMRARAVPGANRSRGISLLHQIAVGEPFRRHGAATLLMDAAEQLARDRGITALGITSACSNEYGLARRLYAQRGHSLDGRGACQDQGRIRGR
jgi:GNAT superfamily N-acetyltransferase